MAPNGKAARLYGQPKVHKSIPEGKRIPPCRPICSQSGANSEFASKFVDIHSKDLLKKIPTFLEDTAHCLRFFEDANQVGLPEDCFPVTVDVTALYTNIPAEGPDGGLEAFEKALETREDKTVPSSYLKSLLQQVLASNIFEFNGQLWKQCIGTAMGTMVAPTYACLFMSD